MPSVAKLTLQPSTAYNLLQLKDDIEDNRIPREASPPPPFSDKAPAARWDANASTYTLQDEVLAIQAPLRSRTMSENTEVLDCNLSVDQLGYAQHEQYATAQEEWGVALSKQPSIADSVKSTATFATAPPSPERH